MMTDLTPAARQRAAWDALRGTSIRNAPWGDLAEDRRYHVNEAARCLVALEASDWGEGAPEQLRGAVDWHTQLAGEIDDEGQRRQQAAAYGYRDTPGSGPIVQARWDAARLIDCAGLLRTLTGQEGKRTGQHALFFCPFHDDRKTPSLRAYEPGKGWHCFTCGAGGDAVALVMRCKGLTAGQALVLLEADALWLPFNAFASAPGAGQSAR